MTITEQKATEARMNSTELTRQEFDTFLEEIAEKCRAIENSPCFPREEAEVIAHTAWEESMRGLWTMIVPKIRQVIQKTQNAEIYDKLVSSEYILRDNHEWGSVDCHFFYFSLYDITNNATIDYISINKGECFD